MRQPAHAHGVGAVDPIGQKEPMGHVVIVPAVQKKPGGQGDCGVTARTR